MNYATIKISGIRAEVFERKPITSGTIGATVAFEFDETWDGMAKTLVWRGSGVTKDDTTCSGVIPAEVLVEPDTRLFVGVYGTLGDTATPTIWADLGVIKQGADPSGDESTDPSLPVWAQLQAEIEALKKAGADPAEIQRIVEAYLAENPPSVNETDPTVPDWAKQPRKPAYTAVEVGALPANTAIPTKVSDLENDSGYQTAEEVTAIVQAQLGVIENGSY